ncbi:SAM-dependent methyltransferase [Streptomyces caeni]|uniref:SAM-dependent methyltransferase n=1 Tax=Streptomyces caeni TaxID=2307231 RepID=A0ABW4IX16_9ACTN
MTSATQRPAPAGAPAAPSSPGPFRTLLTALRSRQIRALMSLSRAFVAPVNRSAFLTGAASSGLLRELAAQPADLASLARRLGLEDEADRLRVWLDIGVKLGDLSCRQEKYALRSRHAKALADPGNDAVVGALEEVTRFHFTVLRDAPDMLRGRRRYSLGDQDGTVIARSSMIVKPFVEAAVDRVLTRQGQVRLLEIGCGSGLYVRHAARRNPQLTGVAVDLQPEVAALAARNLADWGLSERVETRAGDALKIGFDETFDLVTMHQNIYYFPVAERVEALRAVRSLVAPGGRLLITSSCQGGSASLEALNLWLTYADFGGPLPEENALVEQMAQAGFSEARSFRVVPGEQFIAFTGVNGRAS